MTAREGEGFPKTARIRRRREFLSFGRTGEKRRTDSFVLLAEPCAERPRLGITVSRKVGVAVVRNRLKRRVREVYRRHPARAQWERDLIVIARPGAGELSIIEIGRQMDAILNRLVFKSMRHPSRS